MRIEGVKLILCDIDDTITVFKDGFGTMDYLDRIFGLFAEMRTVETGADVSDARSEIDLFADDLIWWDYPDFIAEFDLPVQEAWEGLRAIHSEMLTFHEDAVEMVRKINSAEIPLCVISNNPWSGCLMKLGVAGLADDLSSDCFLRFFATNNCRGMKSQPAMWRRALSSLCGISPADVLTVGDSLKEDYEIPASEGVGRTVIIDRHSNVAEEERDGYLKVNDLRLLEFA